MKHHSFNRRLFAPQKRTAYWAAWIVSFFLIFSFLRVPTVVSQDEEIDHSENSLSFNDVQRNSEVDLYHDHIYRLSQQGVIVGDVIDGRPIGRFRPHDILLRSEFSKLVSFLRLSEEYGTIENWQDQSFQEKEVRVFDLTRNYLNCEEGTCDKIGGPFPDVAQSPTHCIDRESEIESESTDLDFCEPWFGRHVYHGADKGFFRGYDSGLFGPGDKILRLHAIKTLIIDNGHIPPDQDSRYQALESRTIASQSFAPKCIGAAKNYILDLNGGNTKDANKLYEYAAMADRLDVFGNECQVFTQAGATNPDERALFLQGALTRQEAARFFSFTTLYQPAKASAAEEFTLNTAEENDDTAAADESYEESEYVPTDIWLTLEEMSLDEEERDELKEWLGEEAFEEMLVMVREKETEKEKELTEPKETIVEEIFEKDESGPEMTIQVEDKTYLLWDELSEEEQEQFKSEGFAADFIQQDGHLYVNVDQILTAIHEPDFIDAPFVIAEDSLLACLGRDCVEIPPGKKLVLFGIHQEGGALFQNVPINGQLYRISCQELRSPACLEAMAQRNPGRCCDSQSLKGDCPKTDFTNFTISDRPLNPVSGDETIWYQGTRFNKTCFIPSKDLLYGYQDEEDLSWSEAMFGQTAGSCSPNLLQIKMIETYASLQESPLERERMVREIWNTNAPDGLRFYMQIGLDTAEHQAKILEKMIKRDSYDCQQFWYEFMGLYGGHLAASLRHTTMNERANWPLIDWFGI